MPKLLLALTLLTTACFGQYTTGRVEGSLTDATGATVSDASVALKSLQTSLERVYRTGEEGSYFFAAVPPGDYEVSVQKTGFRPASVRVSITTSQTITQDLALEVGDQPMRIEVVSEAAPQFNSFEPVRSVTRSALELTSFPNLSRNIINVISLAPGVQPTFSPRGGQLVTISGAQAGQISANGGRSKAAAHQLDYTDANDWEFGGIALGTQPVPDMMQEFMLLTNNWGAEYGVKSSAQVLMVTRSGSNEFHGSVYDYLQNSALNARDYLDRTGKATPLRQNFFGFTAGGPILKDRTFVFGGYEGRETRGAGSTVVANVPTQAARDRAADAGVRSILQLLPLPANPTANPNVGTVATQLTSPSSSDQFIARGDHRFADWHTITLRYYQNVGTALNRLAGGTLPGFDATFDPVGRNAMFADTLILGSRTANEFRLSYGRSSALFSPEVLPATPRFNVAGLANFGTVNNWPQGRIFNVYQMNDSLTHNRGKHIVKTGFDLRHIQDNSLNDTNRRGVYTFTSLDTLLAGTPSNFSQVFGNTYRGFRTNFHAGFVQDDWRVLPSLTLNLGLRYEFQGGLREVNRLQSVLDPELRDAIGVAGTGALGAFRNESPVVEGNSALVAPRLGFAWNPASQFVLRGGYGIFFDSLIFNGLQAGRTTPPINYTGSLAGAQISGANAFAELLRGTAQTQRELGSQIGSFGALTNLGRIVTTSPRLRNPYAQHFSLGIQYKLTSSVVADVSYVGTKGTALTTYGPANSVARRPAPATSLADEQARLMEFQTAISRQNGSGNTRLDPRFNDVDLLRDNGSSIYHSLQTELRKSLSFGLTLRTSYTWSKSIDNGSDYSPGQNPTDSSFAQDQFDYRAERGVSNFDIPHRFVLAHVWQLPFGKGPLLGGWVFSSINQLQSGIPATILAGPRLGVLDINQDGNGVQGGDNTRANCLEGGSYSQPLLGNNGNCARSTFRMNRLINFDWSLAKQVAIAERTTIEFRTDFFNIFNQPFLTAAGNEWRTVSSPQFLMYNAAGASRRIQMALRLNW